MFVIHVDVEHAHDDGRVQYRVVACGPFPFGIDRVGVGRVLNAVAVER